MDYEYYGGPSPRIKTIIAIIITVILSTLATFGITVTVNQPDVKTITETVTETVNDGGSLELSKNQVPALVDDDRGETVTDGGIPTVEEVDGGKFELLEGEEDPDLSARGEFYRTDTLAHFIADTQYKCVTMNNRYGAQCVSLLQAFVTNYGDGRLWSTCGTGAARGLWTCKEQNAGEDYILITNPEDVLAGDIVVTDGGDYGHVTFAVGPYANGYVAVYGENQGGVACPQGGSQPNVINLAMKKFLGAFRPKTYVIVPETPDTGEGLDVSAVVLYNNAMTL